MSEKPFIARDTKKPLVILGGYEIVEGGKIKSNPLPLHSEKPKATKDDIILLEKHGLNGLEKMMFYGVIDRLKTSGII